MWKVDTLNHDKVGLLQLGAMREIISVLMGASESLFRLSPVRRKV